jgi:pimeloyl-ACP methyl ester carboxylesterase
MVDRDHVLRLLGGEVGTLRVAEAAARGDGFPGDLTLRLSDGTDAPAILLRPPGAGPAPAVLYCHAHGNRYDIGRDELIAGRPALTAPYAPDLLARGYAVLCVEMPCFGARAHVSESAEAKARLWRGTTLFVRMLAEQVAALDWLSARDDVDANRVATLGISMGGTLAWWMAAIDPRIRAAVTLCCFADLECLIRTGNHDGHGHYMTIPDLLSHASTGEVAGLAAPRPQLHCVGLADWSTPEPCFSAARRDLETAFARAGAAGAAEFQVEPETGHVETPAMRARALDFIDRHLSPTGTGLG